MLWYVFMRAAIRDWRGTRWGAGAVWACPPRGARRKGGNWRNTYYHNIYIHIYIYIYIFIYLFIYVVV